MTDPVTDSAATDAAVSHLHRLAKALRDRAGNPVENRLPPKYVAGFADGMRLAADIADQVADLLPAWPGDSDGT
jgi:hypothetical protein